MGQIKNLYKKAHGSFNNPEHKRHWQGGVGIFVMTLFVLSSVLFSKTVQAVIQAAGNYGYYSGSYGYQAGTTSDALPAAATSLTRAAVSTTSMTVQWTVPYLTTSSTSLDNLQDFLFHYSTSSLDACSGGSQFAVSSVASGGSVAVGSSSTGVVVTAADTTPESGDTDSVEITGLSENTTYNFAICSRDSTLNQASALTGSLATTASSSSSGGGQAAGSLSSKTETPTTVVAAVPGGDIVPPASVAVVTSVQGHLGGTVDQALAAAQGSGANLAHTTVVAKQTAAAARQELFGTNNAVVAELLVATGLAKDTTAALGKVNAKALQTLENALAVAVAVRSELGDVIVNGKVVETAAVRTARFLNTVLPPAVLALAVSDANIAGPLAESLIVAAAVGNIDDNLRRELLAKWTTLGVEKADRELANKELELREKQIAGLYLVFYGSGPQNAAQWSLYLAIAYGARHPESTDQRAKEALAMTFYHTKKALVTWPFGPLTLTKSLSQGKAVAGLSASLKKQMEEELNLGLLTAIEESREGKALSKAEKAIFAKDKKGGTVRALAERYYGLGFSLIQSAARADLTGVRALPALPKA